MESSVIAILIALGVYIVAIALIPRRYLFRTESYTQQSLTALERATADLYAAGDMQRSILRDSGGPQSFLAKAFFLIPGTESFYIRLVKAGLDKKLDLYFGSLLVLLVVLTIALRGLGLLGLLAAAIAVLLVGRWVVSRRIAKRNAAFLNLFPDALDMIVRSLRSGYPINATMRMVADNMQSPVSEEFRQVADETAYGSSLVESLKRLAERIDEPDIRFFVVVLAVQQDVGGNLAEVLSNLSTIIRKRKHLRMKIKALTSEGTAAAWVLGLLPLFEFLMIKWVSPNHLNPFFETMAGHLLLASAAGLVLLGVFIVRRMINIDI